MRNFVRALKEARRYWTALVGALACSLCVAALWGANIAALFPIIQTTLNGQSLQQWNEQRLATAKETLAQNETELGALKQNAAGDLDAQQQRNLDLQIDMLEARIQVDRNSVAAAERLEPIFERFFPATPFGTVLLVVTFVFIATMLKQAALLSNLMLVAHVSQGIARDVRTRIFNNALALDRHAFNSVGVSGFTANIAHTTDMLASGLVSFYGGAVTEPLRILACLSVAWFISWRLTLASLIFAPLAAFLMLYLNRRIRGLSRRMLDRSTGFHHVMLEVFNALVTVQAYTMEDFERKRFHKATGELKRSAVRMQLFNALSSPITEALGIGMLCTGLTVSAYLVLNQETRIFGIPMSSEPMSVAAITVFFGSLIGAADPLRKLSGVISGINTGAAAAGMLYPILDRQSRLVEPTNPVPLPAVHRKIEFRDVSFSYDGVNEILRNIELTINSGEHLAVIGPNGGGKSTLINLLCRFYDPQKGDVLIDGVSLRDTSLSELRSRIALVSQQTELFNETIWHNIRYGRWDAADEDVIAAAKLARAHDFVTGFTDGYDTIVGANGQRLSGGQRQRIALARAFLRKADILVLDEATSQIDVDSERLIHDALAEYGRDRTLIMVTHRESTLQLADRIVRIADGEITERKGVELAA